MRAKYEIKTNIKNPRYRKRAEVTVLKRVNGSPTDPVWLSCRRKSYPV